MNMIEDMLTGKIKMHTFLSALKTDVDLQMELRSLVPSCVRDDPECELWKKYSYATLKKYDFDLYELLVSMSKFDGSISDDLNIFSRISRIYCFHHPEVICTKQYENAFDLYLDATKDCFDGPEVRSIVESIIDDALNSPSKSSRRKQAQSEIAKQFRVVDKKPRWIQGPEWPNGVHSPMLFVSQTRKNERVEYNFKDIDTGEIRIVIQYY